MVTDKPLISVIVPIYNVEAYLERCLDSLVSQTYENLEIILIDDGSTDHSGTIADKYAIAHSNITVIHQSNSGLSSARNVGLRLTQGEWLAFVDSDDFVNENYISRLFEIAKMNNADIATCSNKSISYDGSQLKASPLWPSDVITGYEAIQQTFKHTWTSHIWLNLFKAAIFKENQITFPEGKEYESITVKIKTLYYADKVAFTNEKLYSYVSRSGSITHKKISSRAIEDKFAALQDLKHFLKGVGYKDSNSLFNYYEYCIVNSILNDISRNQTRDAETKRIWQTTRNKLASLYPRTKFPSTKQRVLRSALLILSLDQNLYYSVHNKLSTFRHPIPPQSATPLPVSQSI